MLKNTPGRGLSKDFARPQQTKTGRDDAGDIPEASRPVKVVLDIRPLFGRKFL